MKMQQIAFYGGWGKEREREFGVESVCKSLTQPEQGIC